MTEASAHRPGLKAGFSLLRDGNIAKLFVAYLVTYTGTAMAPIAIAFGVLELTGSASAAAVVIAAPTMASIVVILFGGVIADRTSRKRVIYSAELLAMSVQFAMAFALLSGAATVPLLTALMLVNGIAMAFHAPAATGLIIQLVDPASLQSANALLGTARNGAIAGGAALGGGTGGHRRTRLDTDHRRSVFCDLSRAGVHPCDRDRSKNRNRRPSSKTCGLAGGNSPRTPGCG